MYTTYCLPCWVAPGAGWVCHPPSLSAPAQQELPWGCKCEGEKKKQEIHKGGYANFYPTPSHCFVELCPIVSEIPPCLSCLRNNTLPHSGYLCHPAVICHQYVCDYVCLIWTISEQPDSHPQCLCNTKESQMMLFLDQLSMFSAGWEIWQMFPHSKCPTQYL